MKLQLSFVVGRRFGAKQTAWLNLENFIASPTTFEDAALFIC
jgi:hypothetical protein